MSPLPEKVQQFKDFIEDKPKLREAVKNKEYTWQHLFNLWNSRGEEDSFWDDYREEKGKSNKKDSTTINRTLQKFADTFSNIDVDEVDKHVKSLSETIDQLKKLFDVDNKSQTPPEENYPPRHPFHRRYF